MQKVKTLKNLFLLSILLFLMSACSSKLARQEKTLFNASTDVVTDTIKQVYVVNDQGLGDLYYKIKASDQIAVRNLQNLEFGSPTSISNNNVGSTNSTAT